MQNKRDICSMKPRKIFKSIESKQKKYETDVETLNSYQFNHAYVREPGQSKRNLLSHKCENSPQTQLQNSGKLQKQSQQKGQFRHLQNLRTKSKKTFKYWTEDEAESDLDPDTLSHSKHLDNQQHFSDCKGQKSDMSVLSKKIHTMLQCNSTTQIQEQIISESDQQIYKTLKQSLPSKRIKKVQNFTCNQGNASYYSITVKESESSQFTWQL